MGQPGMSTEPNRETRSDAFTSRCGHCGDAFEPTRPHQKFCKPSCRRAAFTGRRSSAIGVSDPGDLFRVPFE